MIVVPDVPVWAAGEGVVGGVRVERNVLSVDTDGHAATGFNGLQLVGEADIGDDNYVGLRLLRRFP